MIDPQIRLALPSKGRMEEETLEFLAGCGLRVDKRNPRQYTA
ncbi:MAG: ATP phosphoribosyltransferase, partial [Chloroflexi bacterium]|nr:ATP phosphoribosyltransferase [Chloroflexota bacterium]